MHDWKQHRQRKITLRNQTGTLDREARTVDAVIATGAWIDGIWGPEKLDMSPGAVNLTRARPSMPWHDDHGGGSLGERVGVAEAVQLDGDTLRATLRASRNPRGEETLRDIEDGIITHTSVGYRVDDAVMTDDGLHITRWTPMEVSTPSMVADIGSVIQRTATMTDPVSTQDHDGDGDQKDVLRAEAQREAREHIQALDKTFQAFPAAGELRSRAIAEGWDLQRANSELLAWVGAAYKTVGRGPDVLAGEDSMEKFVRGASEAIQTRAMLITGDEAVKVRRENDFIGYSLRELAREYLHRANDLTRGDARAIVGAALTRAGIISHSTSDFANILVDASGKALQVGYTEANETYDVWTRPGSLSDFKINHRPKLSTFSDLEEVGEGGEITYGTFSDKKETIALLDYAKLFSITRKAIINDDLGAFTNAPRGMGRAARRKVGDIVYLILSGNPTMSDGNALFSAAHGNYVAAGAGAAPSVATLNAAYTAMATNTDIAGNTLNVVPTFIIAGHGLRGTIDALLASFFNPAEGSTTSFQQSNIWMARLTPVYDARIDNDDAAKWYLAGSPTNTDTIEVAYLDGVQEPRLEREEGFTVDGVTMKVGHDVGAAALEWVNLYHNDGN